MKYAVFFAIVAGGVPLMAAAALAAERYRALLVSLLFFAPILADSGGINFLSVEHYRGPDRGFEVTLTDLVALGLGLALVSKHSARLRWLPHNTVWMALLFGIGVVSTIQGAVPLYGAFTLWKAIRIYLVFWVVVNSLRTGVPLDAVRQGLMAAALVMTASCVKQKFLFHMYRVNGVFDHSNGIPLYANLAIPALVVWAVGDKSLSRRDAVLTLAGALGLVFSVVATQSRAGLVLSSSLLLATLVIAARKAPSRRVGKTSALVLVVMALGGAMAADTIVKRFQEAPESSEEARHEFNKAAKLMAEDRWFGVGLNNFSKVLMEVPRYAENIEVMKGEEEGGVAHHIYWLTAAELGFPALAVFVVILLRFAWLPLRHGLLRRDLDGALLLAFLLGFGALHLQGTLEWGLRITPITFQFTLCCGIVVGIVEAWDCGAAGQSAPPGPALEAEGESTRDRKPLVVLDFAARRRRALVGIGLGAHPGMRDLFISARERRRGRA